MCFRKIVCKTASTVYQTMVRTFSHYMQKKTWEHYLNEHPERCFFIFDFCKNTYERDEGEVKAESPVYGVHNLIGRVRFGINSFFQDARNSFFEHILCHVEFVTSSWLKKSVQKILISEMGVEMNLKIRTKSCATD